MGKKKKELGFDSDGAKKVMRKRDYMADMSGQWALGLMANVVGQLTSVSYTHLTLPTIA